MLMEAGITFIMDMYTSMGRDCVSMVRQTMFMELLLLLSPFVKLIWSFALHLATAALTGRLVFSTPSSVMNPPPMEPNPNYTRSYGYGIEPTTHTGILGTYKVNDEVAFSAGVADTTYSSGYLPGVNSGTTVNALNYPSVLGSIALTAPDSWGWVKGATLNLGAVNSSGTGGAGATSWYAGVTVPTPLTALKFGASWDMLDLHNEGPGNANGDNVWDVALYGNYQVNDKLSFNLRGEYLDQENLGGTSLFLAPVYSQHVEELTATVSYQLWANVLTRAELRWDHSEHGTPFTSGGGTETANAFTLAVNLIYQF